MTSPNQLTANQANAQLSTGPRTPEGKAASAQNARTHGLRSAQAVVKPDEMDEYHALRDGLLSEICPQGALQMVFFEQLLHAAWNQRRCRLMEAVLPASSPHPSVDPMECLSLQGRINSLERYHRRAKQDFNKALAEIRKLQTEQAYREAAAQGAEEPLPSKGLTDTAAVRRLLKSTRGKSAERTQFAPAAQPQTARKPAALSPAVSPAGAELTRAAA